MDLRAYSLFKDGRAIIRDDLSCVGSPERSNTRAVVENAKKELFLLEEVGSERIARRQEMADALDFLKNKGFTYAVIYQKDKQGKTIAKSEGGYYMLSRYVKGIPLARPDFIYEPWRGIVAARMLLALKQASQGISKRGTFFLMPYTRRTFLEIEQNDPLVAEKVRPSFKRIKELEAAEPDFRLGFCHGDFHPLNIIWGARDAKALIDWEFYGHKPEIYDAANMAGCIVMENPRGLEEGFLPAFLAELKKQDLYEESSWKYFWKYVLALRFGWMSEWLMRRDMDMANLEADLMNILMKKIS